MTHAAPLAAPLAAPAAAPTATPSGAADVLDYERLFADYQAGLVDRLRGFGAAAQCLSLWVPDEDPATSLRNLWDAAAAAGEREITVYIGPDTAAVLDDDAVLATAARFGVATLTHGRAGWLVEVQELRTAQPVPERAAARPSRRAVVRVADGAMAPHSPSPGPIGTTDLVSPIYAAAIAQASADVRHEGEPHGIGGVGVHAVVEGTALWLDVDPATHVITRASFTAPTDTQRGLMERLCGLIEGMPVLDAADHGVQHLELGLRDHWSHRPVPGIVTPRSADPCFGLPLALVRAALGEYREATGYREQRSAHDPGPGPRWREMGPAARSAEIRDVLDISAAAHGGAPGDITLVAIELDVRLVLRVHDTLLASGGPAMILAIERGLRAAIDPRLEVVLEEIRDRNRKRRLAVVE